MLILIIYQHIRIWKNNLFMFQAFLEQVFPVCLNKEHPRLFPELISILKPLIRYRWWLAWIRNDCTMDDGLLESLLNLKVQLLLSQSFADLTTSVGNVNLERVCLISGEFPGDHSLRGDDTGTRKTGERERERVWKGFNYSEHNMSKIEMGDGWIPLYF